MSDIDWSKAPEGATHWYARGWFRVVDNRIHVFLPDHGGWVNFPFGSVIEKAIPRPTAEQPLNITDWRDLKVGDVIWWSGGATHDAGEYPVIVADPCLCVSDSRNFCVAVDTADEQWRFVRRPAAEQSEQPNKYSRTVKGVSVDVYDILKAWNVTNPALQHLIKKALQCGERGHKSRVEDLDDILASAKRAKELG